MSRARKEDRSNAPHRQGAGAVGRASALSRPKPRRPRWGEPAIVRLDDLDPETTRLVVALLAMRDAAKAKAA